MKHCACCCSRRSSAWQARLRAACRCFCRRARSFLLSSSAVLIGMPQAQPAPPLTNHTVDHQASSQERSSRSEPGKEMLKDNKKRMNERGCACVTSFQALVSVSLCCSSPRRTSFELPVLDHHSMRSPNEGLLSANTVAATVTDPLAVSAAALTVRTACYCMKRFRCSCMCMMRT